MLYTTEPQRLYGEQGSLWISYKKYNTNNIDDSNSVHKACLLVYSLHWMVLDVSMSFSNLQIIVSKAPTGISKQKMNFFLMYNVATMVGSACNESCNTSLT